MKLTNKQNMYWYMLLVIITTFYFFIILQIGIEIMLYGSKTNNIYLSLASITLFYLIAIKICVDDILPYIDKYLDKVSKYYIKVYPNWNKKNKK